jgi:hypothetical protein
MWRISLLLLSCLIADHAFSNPPPIAPSKAEEKNQANTKDKEQSASTDQRGAESSPLYIKVIPPLPIEPGPTDHAKQSNDYTSPEWWIVWVTLILSVITAILAGYTAKLWGATKSLAEDAKGTADRQAGEMQETLRISRESAKASIDAANIARDAMIAGERAFVFPGKFQFWYRPIANGEKRYYFQLSWENCGDTPTKQLTSHVRFSLRDNRLPEDFDFRYETTEFGRAVIAPKSSVLGPVFPSDGIMPEDLQAVHTSTKFAYVWGWLKYHDVFENTPLRITRYCFQIIVNGNPIDPGPELKGVDFMYPIHPQNNCADEECDQ